MNQHTRQLIIKGYTLETGLEALVMSRRSFYDWSMKRPEKLTKRIENLKGII